MKIHKNLAAPLISAALFAAFLAILSAGSPALAETAKAPNQIDSKAAFAKLKTLAGAWEADTTKGKVRTTFELTAGGSVLIERDNMPGEGEMYTAYHLDGDKLVLTHYCLAGNQPHMVARQFDAASGELAFAFNGGTNLTAGPGHIDAAKFVLTSDNSFEAKWNFALNSGGDQLKDFRFTRVR